LGFRDGIKKGGGFLNNVDGVVQSYEFTPRFKGEKKDSEWIYFVPTIQVDGADEPVDQHLFLGAAERYEISKDGQELTMADESPVTFGFSTPFGRLMDSLVEKGFDESLLPDLSGGDALELSAIVGERFRFVQEVDEAANEKIGKRKVKKNGKTVEYNRTNTVISAVLGAKSNGKSSGKANKAEATGSAKGGKKSKGPSEDDLKSEAADVLKDVLAKNGDTKRKDLSLPVSKALIKNDNKDALKAIILDEDWQDEQDFITVDKRGLISLTEE